MIAAGATPHPAALVIALALWNPSGLWRWCRCPYVNNGLNSPYQFDRTMDRLALIIFGSLLLGRR